MFQRVITPAAKKSLKRLSHDAQEHLLEETKTLETDPYQGERLHNPLSFLYSFHFTFQGTHYRVAYSIESKQNLTIIHLVGPRENFYDRLRRLFGQ